MTTSRYPRLRDLLAYLVVGLVRFYQRFISPALPRSCKYHPTCSQYAVDAVRQHGALRGMVLAGWRLLRCNPFSHGGYDPVERQKLFRKRRADVRSPRASRLNMGAMRGAGRGVTMLLLVALVVVLVGLPVFTGACSLFGGEETTTTAAVPGEAAAGAATGEGATGEAGEATTSSIETTTTTVEAKKDSLGFMAKPLKPLQGLFFKVLEFLHNALGVSWAWAIVILTIIVRIVLIPLTWKQIKSMRAMQAVQPQMKALQERYKNDRELMNQKLMEFYKEHNVSPFGSCLPLLLQMPVFFGLFYLLRTAGIAGLDPAVSGRWAGIFAAGSPDHPVGWLWIGDITQFDYILMFLFIGSQFLASWQMARKAGGQQKMISYMMPIVVGIFMFIGKWPSGLFIYWVTSNVWTIAQQFIAEKVSPVPVAGLEPVGKKKPSKGGQRKGVPAKKAPAGKKPAAKAPAKSAGKPSGKRPAKPPGKAPAKPPGKAPAKASGKRPAKPTGKAPAKTSGKRPAKPAGSTKTKAPTKKPGAASQTKASPQGKRPAQGKPGAEKGTTVKKRTGSGAGPAGPSKATTAKKKPKPTTGRATSEAGSAKKKPSQADAGRTTPAKPARRTGGKTSGQKPRKQNETTGSQGQRADS